MKHHKIILTLGTTAGLAAVGLGLGFLLRAFGFFIRSLDSDFSRLALCGYSIFLLSTLIIARSLARRGSSPDSGPAKEALYERVLTAWSAAHRRGSQTVGQELDDLERHLLLRGSRSVLDCYLTLRRLERPFDPSIAATQSALQRLVTEMRRDLGHSNLAWASTATAELLFRPREASRGGAPGSREFKVLEQLQV